MEAVLVPLQKIMNTLLAMAAILVPSQNHHFLTQSQITLENKRNFGFSKGLPSHSILESLLS